MSPQNTDIGLCKGYWTPLCLGCWRELVGHAALAPINR